MLHCRGPHPHYIQFMCQVLMEQQSELELKMQKLWRDAILNMRTVLRKKHPKSPRTLPQYSTGQWRASPFWIKQKLLQLQLLQKQSLHHPKGNHRMRHRNHPQNMIYEQKLSRIRWRGVLQMTSQINPLMLRRRPMWNPKLPKRHLKIQIGQIRMIQIQVLRILLRWERRRSKSRRRKLFMQGTCASVALWPATWQTNGMWEMHWIHGCTHDAWL